MTTTDLESYIVPGMHGHLIGIGGVSMSPLAEALQGMGITVTGSDISDGPAIRHLRESGIQVHIGHHADNIRGADFIVRTAAVRAGNPEVDAARANGIPLFERAQGWGYIMRQYKNAICIAGTHGKTTTTSMMTHILMAAGKDPTVMIGGTLPMLGAGHRVGGGDTIVLESCEYYNSFHSFFPTIAVILNVDADHLDFFENLDNVKASFRTFAGIVPETGHIVANADDPNTMDALAPLNRRLITFGLGETARIRAVCVENAGDGSAFTVLLDGAPWASVRLRVPGVHNLKNALAAISAAICLGLPPKAVEEGLWGFTGTMRRFEFKGTYHGADIYDDYAHHPSELGAVLDAVDSLPYKRVIVAFQPHTYTRTKKLFAEFAAQLKRPALVLLADIYAAREQNTVGISSMDLAGHIPGAVYCGSFTEIEERLKALASPGDIILTVGAGDIYKVGEHLLSGA